MFLKLRVGLFFTYKPMNFRPVYESLTLEFLSLCMFEIKCL
jgi:hypothetical protein